MLNKRRRGHWCRPKRKRVPLHKYFGWTEHVFSEVPPVVRADIRQGVHVPSGEPFSLCLLECAIVAATADTVAGAALLGDKDSALWANDETWWLTPPERTHP